nr:retrovirus-related Pol polyprotein from transposon TNT 1-94 [Tanacetum cinerariifolium]
DAFGRIRNAFSVIDLHYRFTHSDDEGSTKIRAFMAITEDEPSVGKADARSGQWVDITKKKVRKLLSMTDGDDRKHVLNYTHVDLLYVEDQRKTCHTGNPTSFDWWIGRRGDPRVQRDDWEFVRDQGSRLDAWDAPKDVEASSPAINREGNHTVEACSF